MGVGHESGDKSLKPDAESAEETRVRRVLLIDDDPRITKITGYILEKAGFEVDVTNRAFGVLNLVAQTRPDVVVMDMRMPGLSGPELLELLRADPELARTRVVFFSGLLEDELEACARTAGADGFVHKTAPPAELIRVLRAA